MWLFEKYQVPSTKFQIPNSKYQIPKDAQIGICYLLFVISHLAELVHLESLTRKRQFQAAHSSA